MADVRSLEHPTLKVPYEILNKRFRSAQKVCPFSTLLSWGLYFYTSGGGQGSVTRDQQSWGAGQAAGRGAGGQGGPHAAAGQHQGAAGWPEK